MTSALERAEQLRDDVAGLLAGEGIAAVHVTMDAAEAPNQLAAGQVVVVIEPPRISWQTYTLREYEWTVSVIAGPYTDPLGAWRAMEPVIDALAVPLSIDAAVPSRYAPPNAPQYPAYQLTFTETI